MPTVFITFPNHPSDPRSFPYRKEHRFIASKFGLVAQHEFHFPYSVNSNTPVMSGLKSDYYNDRKLAGFGKILSNLPTELKIKIFNQILNNFDRFELLDFIEVTNIDTFEYFPLLRNQIKSLHLIDRRLYLSSDYSTFDFILQNDETRLNQLIVYLSKTKTKIPSLELFLSEGHEKTSNSFTNVILNIERFCRRLIIHNFGTLLLLTDNNLIFNKISTINLYLDYNFEKHPIYFIEFIIAKFISDIKNINIESVTNSKDKKFELLNLIVKTILKYRNIQLPLINYKFHSTDYKTFRKLNRSYPFSINPNINLSFPPENNFALDLSNNQLNFTSLTFKVNNYVEDFEINSQFLSIFENLQHLNSLTIFNQSFSNNKMIKFSKPNSNIYEIYLHFFKISPKNLSLNLKNFKNLKKLYISMIDFSVGKKKFKPPENIEILVISLYKTFDDLNILNRFNFKNSNIKRIHFHVEPILSEKKYALKFINLPESLAEILFYPNLTNGRFNSIPIFNNALISIYVENLPKRLILKNLKSNININFFYNNTGFTLNAFNCSYPTKNQINKLSEITTLLGLLIISVIIVYYLSFS